MVKRLLGVLVTVLFLMTLAWPAVAADKFSIGGEYRAWFITDKDADYNSDEDDDAEYIKQRLRVGLTFTPNENLTVFTRIDWAEGVWGQDFNDWNGWASAKEGSEIGVDYAWAQVKKGIFSAKVGSHWSGTANYILWDQDGTGITIDLATPVAVKVNYTKANEGSGSGDSTDDDPTTPDVNENDKDIDLYGVYVGYSGDKFGVNLTGATRQDDSEADASPWAVGVQFTAKLGMVALNLEVDQFGGTAGELDVVGTQAYLDLGANFTKSFKCGLRGVYAMGTDDLTSEVQYTSIQAGAETFSPFGFEGAMIWYPWGAAGYPFGVNTYSGNFGVGDLAGPFDPAGASAGVMGFCPYINVAASDALKFYGKVAYVTPQEDANTSLDNQTAVVLEADYLIFGNMTLSAGYIYQKPEFDDDTPSDPRQLMIAQLKVDF